MESFTETNIFVRFIIFNNLDLDIKTKWLLLLWTPAKHQPCHKGRPNTNIILDSNCQYYLSRLYSVSFDTPYLIIVIVTLSLSWSLHSLHNSHPSEPSDMAEAEARFGIIVQIQNS